MAITLLGSATTGQQGYGANITQAHTIPTGGVNSILVVGILAFQTIGTPTYNGDAMTLAKLGADNNTSVWYLLNPASGTHDIVVPLNSGTTRGVLIAQAFNGRNLATPIGATATAAGQSAPNNTLTLDASAGAAFNFVGELPSSPNSAPAALTDWTHGAGQTLLLNATDGTEYNAFCSASYKIGAMAMSVSSSLYRLWSHTGVVILAEPMSSVDLAPSSMSGGTTIATGTVTYTAPVAGVTNLTAAPMSGGATISTGVVSYAPAVIKLTTDPFKAWGDPTPLIGLTVPHTSVSALDGTFMFHVAGAVTDSLGRLVLVNGSLTAGNDYAVSTWDATGANRGCKIYRAA